MRTIQFDQCKANARPVTVQVPNPENPTEAMAAPGVLLTIIDPHSGTVYELPMPRTSWDELHAQASGIVLAPANGGPH